MSGVSIWVGYREVVELMGPGVPSAGKHLSKGSGSALASQVQIHCYSKPAAVWCRGQDPTGDGLLNAMSWSIVGGWPIFGAGFSFDAASVAGAEVVE